MDIAFYLTLREKRRHSFNLHAISLVYNHDKEQLISGYEFKPIAYLNCAIQFPHDKVPLANVCATNLPMTKSDADQGLFNFLVNDLLPFYSEKVEKVGPRTFLEYCFEQVTRPICGLKFVCFIFNETYFTILVQFLKHILTHKFIIKGTMYKYAHVKIYI